MNRLLSILFLVFLLSNTSKAQTPFGLNDPTFNQSDIGKYVGDQIGASSVEDVYEFDDGSVILVGSIILYENRPVNHVVKLLPNGHIDTSFCDAIFGVGYYAKSVAVQSDGKIIIGGDFTTFSGSNSKRIIRLNPDGTVDGTFQSGVGFNAVVTSIEIQSDGKIYCGGEFSLYNNQPTTQGIIRLNPDGTKDNTFINNFMCLYGSIKEFEIQDDGKIIGIGNMGVYYPNGNTHSLLRINPNGSIDSLFNVNIGTGLFGDGNRLALDDLGRILIAGSFTGFNGSSTYANFIRLNPDGSVDNQFQCFGLSNVRDVEIHESTQEILVSANFNLLKLDSTGVAIPGWYSLFPYYVGAIPFNISVKEDHFIAFGYLIGLGGQGKGGIGKWSINGTFDENFGRGYGANGGEVRKVIVDSQDRILISGDFSQYNNDYARGLARLNQNGTLDTSFHLKIFNVDNFLLVDDTNYLVFGIYNYVNDLPISNMVKILSNGSIDFPFTMGQSGPDNRVRDGVVQPDGKIVLVGDFTIYNGLFKNRIVRINPNGSVDNSFNIGSGFNSIPLNIEMQTDGKFLVSGLFSTYKGVSCPEIIRLNSDGSRDLSFNPGASPLTNYYPGFTIHQQSDGKILVSGPFTSFVGLPNKGFIRLNTDGSVDNSFNPPTTQLSEYGIRDFQIVDSSIYIAGFFNELDNQIAGHFAKLNMDGSLTNQFTNHGADSIIDAFDFQSNGKIIIGGGFGSYDHFGKNRVARLFPCDPSWSEEQISSCDPIMWDDMTTYSSDTTSVYFAFISLNGCDSIVMLNLNILEPTNSIELQTACDSYVWPMNGTTYTVSGQYTDTISNAAGCDSIITLDLTINHVTTGTDFQTACDSLSWIDGNIYYSSTNNPTWTLTSSLGCDSIITLDLTIIPSLPLTIENSFSMPSDANSCVGETAIDLSGNAGFGLDFDNGSQIVTSNGYSLVTGLCAGVHDLHVTDNCGDTLSAPVVIPVDSNFVFNNPFIDSLAQDSLGVTLTNCDIYYAGIDTAYIDSIWATGNTVSVIWNIVDSNGSNFDTTTYVLNNGNGVYWLQLSVFCPNKSLGEYFTVTEAIYFNNGSVSTAGLADYVSNLFEIYPNPTNDQVHISFSGSEADLTVFDLQGKVVLKNQIQNNGIVSLQNFERGVYLFDFRNSQGHSVQRVVKQ